MHRVSEFPHTGAMLYSVGEISVSRQIGHRDMSDIGIPAYGCGIIICRSNLRIATCWKYRRVGHPNSCLPHIEFTSPMWVVFGVLYKTFSDRIFVTITNNFVQGFITADPMVIVVRLPDGTVSPQPSVDSVCCESLERLYEARQSLFVSKLEYNVNVVWHHHDAHPFETGFGFKPLKGSIDNSWNAGVR